MAGRIIVNPHNNFFHSAMEHNPVARDFMNYLLPENIRRALDIESLNRLSTTYVYTKLLKGFSDVVFRCELLEKPDYIGILVEHQSSSDKWLPFRVEHYLFGLLNSINRDHPGKPLPAIYTLVFYHGAETPYPYSLNLLDCFDDPLNIMKEAKHYRPLPLIDVNQIPDEELLQRQWMGPVAMALKHIREEDITPHALAIFDAVAAWPLDHSETVELLQLLLNYLFNVGNIEDIGAFIEAAMNRLFEPLRSEVMTIAEKLREQGMKKGIQKGIRKGKREGREEGKIEGKQEVALMMLREGLEIAVIAKVTGLPIMDIERLRDSSMDRLQ